ncbi:MAG TPA: anthranilate phosphoribosyltransferase, partial [Myxococcaceae bacterium]|nr:anthranilate phosphoribosyltransferase [Myxococcaceae bacterium]
MEILLAKLVNRSNLAREEMAQAVTEVAEGRATPAQIAALLTALKMKGETAVEIAAAAEVMRGRLHRVNVSNPVFIDTCGTGGDGLNTFNISTGAALVVAAAGVVVAKHGNRAASSRCGSADVLAALGVNVDAARAVIERCIEQVGIGFLFVPHYHPAFKSAHPVRRELGFRTVFNLLGPLLNPAGARRQVMGVNELRWVRLVGEVQALLGAEHAWVVHGQGLDELTVTG